MTSKVAKLYRCPNCAQNQRGQQNYVRHLLEEARALGRPGVTTNEFLRWGAGSRFGARIHELRHDWGLHITEVAELYTLLPGLAASTMTVEAPVGVALMGGVVAGRESVQHDDGWRRDWLCVRCAYRPAGGPVCARGHDAILGWVFGDAPVEQTLELPVAA